MKRVIFILLLLPNLVFASGGEGMLMEADIDLRDHASLQEGAKWFMNYCSGCHSLDFSRFQRVAKDLGLTEEQMKKNLMFTAEKIGEPMNIAMKKNEAKNWFGVPPPDLSVTTRARGVDWVYTYLMTFYLDEKRPWGVNNLAFKDVAMPHVLWELQGLQKPVYKQVKAEDGSTHEIIEKLEPVEFNQKKADDYRRTVNNIVAFLAYVGEPVKVTRQDLGWKVLLFILFFTFLAYTLKKEYWKDLH